MNNKEAIQKAIDMAKEAKYPVENFVLIHDPNCTDNKCTDTCVVNNLIPHWRELPKIPEE